MKKLRTVFTAACLMCAAALLFSTAAMAAPPQQQEQDQHPHIDPGRIVKRDRVPLKVPDFPSQGWVLDIGGGGEGIIGRIKGADVIAIDPSARELAGAPGGPLKIVMNGKDLKFLDGTFATSTCFFTMMYIPREERAKVFAEVARVLKPGGSFLVWDVILPPRPDPAKDIVAFYFTFQLPKEEVQTGYGAFWPEAGVDLDFYTGLAMEAGFRVRAKTIEGATFFLELVKN